MQVLSLPRNRRVYQITFFQGLQKVVRDSRRQLPLLSPLSDRVEVLALVLGVEIDEGLGCVNIPPHLAQESGIWLAHQLLADDVEAVSYARSVCSVGVMRKFDLQT